MTRPVDYPAVTAPPTTFLDTIVRTRKVVVCCGAGGVGKTTTSAALGLAGALAGRKTLVLTIDPARRLAEAMGIPEAAREPTRLDPARLAGIAPDMPGELWAWMLHPGVVFEGLVRRLATSPEKAEEILKTRLFHHISNLVAGMQEYTAAEALYNLSHEGQFDLVVLDTPPSRNALEFLDAPRKLAGFLDERVISIFLPKQGGILRAASSLVSTVFTRVFGEGFYEELQTFLGAFSGMFGAMRSHAVNVRELLMSKDAAFVLVTSPEPSAMAEAKFFQHKIEELKVPFEGYVLNRSWAYTRGFADPSHAPMPPDAAEVLVRALHKLAPLAAEELGRAERDRTLLGELRDRSPGGAAIATPHLGGAIEDLQGLVDLAKNLVGGHVL